MKQEKENMKRVKRPRRVDVILTDIRKKYPKGASDVRDRMSYDEAIALYLEAAKWCSAKNQVMQSFMNEECSAWAVNNYLRNHYPDTIFETNEERVEKEQEALKVVIYEVITLGATHLKMGRKLKLKAAEQSIYDILVQFISNIYRENYMVCAKDLAVVIENCFKQLKRNYTEKQFVEIERYVFRQLVKITKRHKVKWDYGPYNLTKKYLKAYLRMRYYK